jgi:hypothetical protein
MFYSMPPRIALSAVDAFMRERIAAADKVAGRPGRAGGRHHFVRAVRLRRFLNLPRSFARRNRGLEGKPAVPDNFVSSSISGVKEV